MHFCAQALAFKADLVSRQLLQPGLVFNNRGWLSVDVFLFILTKNIIPIFCLICLGFFLDKLFDLNIYTLSKLNFYVFVPAFTLHNLYTTRIPLEMLKVLAAAILLLAANYVIVTIIAKKRKMSESLKNAFINSVSFYNSGNIGVPLITLVFSNAPYYVNGETPYLKLALTAQVMIMVFQNVTTNSIGFINAGRAKLNWRDTIKIILRMPAIYAMPLAMLLKVIPYDMTDLPVWPVFEYISKGLVAFALLTLGVQLSKSTLRLGNINVYISSFVRLIGGPILAFIIIRLLGLNGIIAQVVMISSSVPTSVNSALIAVEFDNEPDFASQAVLTSTLLSTVTLIFVIYLSGKLFPV